MVCQVNNSDSVRAVVEPKQNVVSILAPGALMILMFMLIFVGGTPAMQGVVEEKMQRIAEMVLSDEDRITIGGAELVVRLEG